MAVSPIDITKALGGMDFPASKQELVDHANGKKVDKEVLDLLKRLPDQQYETMRDVEHAYSEVR
ncbi:MULTISPECIES: DUF2795 domain-containing protein [unclassified Leptolyngbya]|uniref:DUF2795 domain-containing protein n=1 Tax=unclassified Leptolyngbya TaxID=2650499 RepID=UPI0016840F78|nr:MULTISPECIES: DUF2795 domain-containing protein [unclassified Leptolyngbya]MBD1912497.1 DUF2795 domain-containing protein [Leptolyngbya sp. FACHB-8]MBD2156492.1 DUF2795 domain-containing protein [Leptolyngbya sp. FACHB-16]